MLVFQNHAGSMELKADVIGETLWANRMQMAEIFDVNPQAISKHIQNIYKEKELTKEATSSKMELVQTESNRKVSRTVEIFNPISIITFGYHFDSKYLRELSENLMSYATKKKRY